MMVLLRFPRERAKRAGAQPIISHARRQPMAFRPFFSESLEALAANRLLIIVLLCSFSAAAVVTRPSSTSNHHYQWDQARTDQLLSSSSSSPVQSFQSSTFILIYCPRLLFPLPALPCRDYPAPLAPSRPQVARRPSFPQKTSSAPRGCRVKARACSHIRTL